MGLVSHKGDYSKRKQKMWTPTEGENKRILRNWRNDGTRKNVQWSEEYENGWGDSIDQIIFINSRKNKKWRKHWYGWKIRKEIAEITRIEERRISTKMGRRP